MKLFKLNPRYARLWQCGFELNSTAANVEFTGTLHAAGGVIVTSPVRSGTYSFQTLSTNTSASDIQSFSYQFLASAATSHFFLRTYIYIDSSTSWTGSMDILEVVTGATLRAAVRITPTNTLQLFNASTQIGSDSAALSTNTWYRVEIEYDSTTAGGSNVLTLKIEGATIATSSAQTLGTVDTIKFGPNNATATGTIKVYLDDIALNDSSGTNQNSFPGDGKIIHLHPNAVGDVNTWTIGTPPGGSNFQKVSEVTPDDGSSDIKSKTLNNEDLYKCGASGIGASDTVNVVAVGVRFSNDTADATTAVKLEIEKAPSGTKSQSAAIVVNTTVWSTNSKATPHNYPLVTYQDPNSSNWTQSTLDTMQIGALLSTGGTNNILLTTVWASVDYTSSTTPTTRTSDFFHFFPLGN